MSIFTLSSAQPRIHFKGRREFRFRQMVEAAPLAGIGFTDHPAPTHKWLHAGGHDALDPFTALSFCAAVTD